MPREVDSRPAPLEDPLHELLAWTKRPRYKSLGKSQRRQNLKGGIAKVATGSQDSHKGTKKSRLHWVVESVTVSAH